VSVIASQGRIHMVGTDFDKLEEQLCSMTPDDDRSQMHDDRADAWVWAMRELTGQAAASYKEVYGFVPCKHCGKDLNEKMDKVCKHGGAAVTEPEKEAKPRDRSTRWSAAYVTTCPQGHEYPLRTGACPKCKSDPAAYLAAVAKLTGGNQGW